MRMQILSDLHFEFHADRGRAFVESLDTSGVDVLVVAGDLAPCRQLERALLRLSNRYPHVVFVAGNHEAYHASPSDVAMVKRELRRVSNLHWLECETVTIGGVRFVGTTLWFEQLPGRTNYLNDFDLIEDFVPWVYEQNREAQVYLETAVRQSDVVVTHHLPSHQSVAPRFVGSPLNRFFVSDVERVMRDKRPQLWVHGHTHASCDYRIDGTRVVCNPLGYVGHDRNSAFNDRLIVEVKS